MLQGIIDIHCHILPGVDDGARDQKEAEKMLQAQKRMGVEQIILTPHYAPGRFMPSVSQIYEAYQNLKPDAEKVGIRLALGREYRISSGFEEDLHSHQLPTMAESAYVLIEFSSRNSYYTVRNTVEQMLHEGYLPIIAHIERYPCMRMIKNVEEVYRMGASIQVNAGTFMGKSGREIKEYGWKLLNQGLIHFIASDAHRMDTRKPNLGSCYKLVKKKMGQDLAEKIFRRNPLMLIDNKEIE